VVGLIATCLAVSAAAGTASARPTETTVSPGWADEPTISDIIERRGILYAGRVRAVDLASCIGLRRYGVRVIDYFQQFHRFRCTVWGADMVRYAAWVRVPRSNARFVWWQVDRVLRVH
jgi:hypothetical protein